MKPMARFCIILAVDITNIAKYLAQRRNMDLS
jgi:hypothetical protein